MLSGRRALSRSRAGSASGGRLGLAVERLTVPTLLVRGGMSDVVSAEAAREFLELVPHARLVEVDRAAHMVAGDRNDRFSDAVLAFLETLPAVPHA